MNIFRYLSIACIFILGCNKSNTDPSKSQKSITTLFNNVQSQNETNSVESIFGTFRKGSVQIELNQSGLALYFMEYGERELTVKLPCVFADPKSAICTDNGQASIIKLDGSDLIVQGDGKTSYSVLSVGRWVRRQLTSKSSKVLYESNGFRAYKGAVLDTSTSLMWASDFNSTLEPLLRTDAINYVNNLDLEGYGDWRLPTRDELELLFAHGDPTTGYYNKIGFKNISDSFFWTSSLKDIGFYVIINLKGEIDTAYTGQGFYPNSKVLPVREFINKL